MGSGFENLILFGLLSLMPVSSTHLDVYKRQAEQGKTTDAPDLPGKKLLAPKDVEREFGIHQKTLAYWHMEGVGPVYTNFGRRVFYERAVLEEYIASGRVQTSESIK